MKRDKIDRDSIRFLDGYTIKLNRTIKRNAGIRANRKLRGFNAVGMFTSMEPLSPDDRRVLFEKEIVRLVREEGISKTAKLAGITYDAARHIARKAQINGKLQASEGAKAPDTNRGSECRRIALKLISERTYSIKKLRGKGGIFVKRLVPGINVHTAWKRAGEMTGCSGWWEYLKYRMSISSPSIPTARCAKLSQATGRPTQPPIR